MATSYFNLHGEAYWCKLKSDSPDEYAGDRRWLLTLKLDDLNEYIKTGLTLKVRDLDGGKAVTLRRSTKKLIGENLVIFTPPILLDATGEMIRHSYIMENDEEKVVRSFNKGEAEPALAGKDLLIPNGSKVVANVAVYDTQKGKGHRLESVKIISLAEMPPMSENKKIEAAAEPTTKTTEETGPKLPW